MDRKLALIIFSLLFLTGCDESRYMKIQTAPAKLRLIEPVSMPQLALAEDPNHAAPPAAPAETKIRLEDCRASALANNLELSAQLINPTIAAEEISQEEARFESVLFANANYSTTDVPNFSPDAADPNRERLRGSQANVYSADLGVNVPLRTGGLLTFDLPASRLETMNTQFITTDSIVQAVRASDVRYTTDFRASISQPLLRNAGVRVNTFAIRLARYNNQIAEAQTKLNIIRVLAGTDIIYWRLYAARRELEVHQRQYDLAVAQLERARRLVAAKVAAEVEVLSAETGVAESLQNIIIAENVLRQRQRELKRVLNRPDLPIESPTILVPATEPDPVHYQLDPAQLAAAAMEQRMELLELQIQVACEEDNLEFNKNQALPLLALQYTSNINGLGRTLGESFAVLDDSDFIDHSIGIRGEIPLGNQAAKSRIRQSRYRIQQTLVTKEQRQQQIRQEIYDSVDSLEAAWQQVLASRQRSILAGRNLEAEQRQFELGLHTSTDVLTAQTRFIEAQSAEIRALTDYQVAQIDIATATGTLLGAAKVRWEPKQ